MELLKSKNEQLYDPIRKKWVDQTPEEQIRQQLLHRMIDELGYPPAFLAIEKELIHLTRTCQRQIPKRRADIVVFVKEADGSLSPLLMIECKASVLTPKFAQQVIGYNAFVKAPFIALVNAAHILTGRFCDEAGMYRFEKGLATFSELIEMHRTKL